MSSSNNDPILYVIIGFFGGIYTFFKGFRTFREYRVVEDTPEMPVRSIAMGLVRVHAKAVGSELIPSPVTHTPCCFYKVDIERWHQDKNGGHWSNYRTDADGIKFYLQDNSGKVLVDAHGAEYDLVLNARVETGGKGGFQGASSGASEAELRSYVTQVTAKKISSFVERRLSADRPNLDAEHEKRRQAALAIFQHPLGSAEFLEQMLAAQGPRLQQHLVDMGPQSDPQKEQARLAMIEAYKHPAGSPEFAQNMQRAMAAQGGTVNLQSGPGMTVTTRVQFSIGSTPSRYPSASGRFRFTEFCILPDHWYDVTGTCTENPNPQDEHDRNLILKGRNEPTFLISYRAEKEVESRLRRRAALQIFGGAAVSVACLAYILYRLGLF